MRRSEVTVVAGDLPIKQHIFHFRTGADIVNDHVTPSERTFLVYDDADMNGAVGQVPGDQVARQVIFGLRSDREFLALAAEKDHQVGYAAVVDVAIGMLLPPSRH